MDTHSAPGNPYAASAAAPISRQTITQLLRVLSHVSVPSEDAKKLLQALEMTCKRVGDDLDVWRRVWNTPGIRTAEHAVQQTLDALVNECRDWQGRWYGYQPASDDAIARDLRSWNQTLTDRMDEYNTTLLHELGSARGDALAGVLGQEAAHAALRGMTETHNGALKLELQGLLDAGCEALRFPNLFEAGALALFHALRSLLTLDNVPSSVRLSDLDLGSMAVISNPGSDIFRTQWRGTVVAIKRFRESNSNPRRAGRFLYAGAIWRMLDHPNVLPFYGIHIQDMGSRKSIALVTLWADNSDVLNYMRIRPDCDRRSLVKQTASGLAYLHRHGIVHGDVRGSNILIDGQGRPMLGDYGQASALTSDPEALIEGLSTSEISSTIRWLAPELTHTRFPELPADVFSFGRTILELMTGEKPFNEHRNVWQIASMLNQGRLSPKRPADPRVVQRGLTDEVWELMGEMWENAPAERPEMDVVEERLEQLM